MKKKIIHGEYCVLLCAHNGANYLYEQLESIASQHVAPACVLFFDDGSTDETLNIARRFENVLPLVFVQLNKRRNGAAGAFDAILIHAAQASTRYDTYLLCDQDDIWEPFKAARLLERLAQVSSGTPALVHSELKCFGSEAAGREFLHLSLGHSVLESMPSMPLQSLLFENVVVGASVAFNRDLLERATPMPMSAYMHDWWLAIVCVAHGGQIQYVPEALTRYRIHSRSTLGRTGNFLHALPRRLRALSKGAFDPWLLTVGEQLKSLPFGGDILPEIYFEPFLADSRTLFRQSSLRLRYQAWRRLCQRRIWSKAFKDAYYKTRLFTDYVV